MHKINNETDYSWLVASCCYFLAKRGGYKRTRNAPPTKEFMEWYENKRLGEFAAILSEAYTSEDWRACISIIKYTTASDLPALIEIHGNPYPWIEASRKIAAEVLRNDMERDFREAVLSNTPYFFDITPSCPPSHLHQIWLGLNNPKVFAFADFIRKPGIIRFVEKQPWGLRVRLVGGGDLVLNGDIQEGEPDDLVDLVKGPCERVAAYRLAWHTPVNDNDDIREILKYVIQEQVLRPINND